MMDGKRVLIIEDDESVLRLFKTILQKKGYEADTAQTGREALEKIQRGRYDVVLVDVVLPDTNGLDLLSRVPLETKKIVITGTDTEENRRKAASEGADAFYVKPIKAEKLLEIIR